MDGSRMISLRPTHYTINIKLLENMDAHEQGPLFTTNKCQLLKMQSPMKITNLKMFYTNQSEQITVLTLI